MKRTVLTALTIMALGGGVAFAQGKPPGTDPGTAPQAFPNEPYHTGTVFSEIFGHSRSTPEAANKTAAARNTSGASGS
jgi:hypothetical protein